MTASAEPTESKGVLSALRNGVAVLRAFSTERPLLGVTEIAEQTGMHKSSVSRLLAALEDEGMLDRDTDSRKYRLGLGLVTLAGPILGEMDVRRAARPVLRALRDQTDETAALMVWSNDESVCVGQEPSRRLIKHSTPLGIGYRTALSASVMAFMSAIPAPAALDLLETGRLTLADNDPVGHRRYLDRVREQADRGWFVNDRATAIDEVGVAALVHDYRGDVAGAVLVAAPSYRVTAQEIDDFGHAVKAAADEVAQRLGFAEQS